ncbi:MAG TPA: FtsW/RodA/SpoVE family cell cycle protein [Anaerolineales bacterium]|nr:FtsW/RodA/SpoVE family cell cycle protein [Anaerolineales bacterium]
MNFPSLLQSALSVSSATRRERRLLVIAAVFVLIGFIALSLAPAVRQADWTALQFDTRLIPLIVVWGSGAVLGHLWLEIYTPNRDPFIFPVTMLLCGWGLILVYRLEPDFGTRQGVWLLISLVMAGIALYWTNFQWLAGFKYLLLVSALFLVALTILFGVNPSGSGPRLWLGCCQGWNGIHLYFQPSELLKLLLIVFLAAYLSEKFPLLLSEERKFGLAGIHWRLPTAFFLPLAVMWGISLILLILQRDLGTGILLFGLFLVMLYVATGELSSLALGFLSLLAGGALGYWLYGLVRLRITAWLNPWADASGDAYQIVQALLALAAGNVFGQGIGLGAARVIPVVHSDFVFAALVEEWGLLGGLASIALLAVLVMRGLQTAQRQTDPYESLLAVGITGLLGLQALLIMGGVVRLFPLTGVILPFLSYGGSGMLVNWVMVAWLIKLSHNCNTTEEAK